jgi:crossover junction endodeoxyribonuclease RusA
VKALTFRVDGLPAPKGSTKAFVVRGRAIVTEDNARTRPWAALVRDAARESTGGTIVAPRGVPVRLTALFDMARPVSLPKRVTAATKKPDLDKLTRAVKDALTGIVWQDDSQVVALTATKQYAVSPGRPGVTITVEAA